MLLIFPMLLLKRFMPKIRQWREGRQQKSIGTILESVSILQAAKLLGEKKTNTLRADMKIELKPINNRFKRLIHDFGKDWVATCDPKPMHCFDGMLGITAIPADGTEKWSNFKWSDIKNNLK